MSLAEYKSNKSVAKNKTVYLAADDPRLSWDQEALTRMYAGAEIVIVGSDGIYQAAGGASTTAPVYYDPASERKADPGYQVPPSGNGPGIFYENGSGVTVITPTDPSDVVATWSGDDLVITFNWDYENSLNSTVSQFILTVTAGGETRTTPTNSFVPNKTQDAQTITFTKILNTAMFNVFRPKIESIFITAADPFNNKSNPVSVDPIPTYVLDLPTPVISVAAISNGYTVSYTTPTQSSFNAIDIWEIEDSGSTAPVISYAADGITPSNYSRVYFDYLNPANVLTPNENKRWVIARFASDGAIFTSFCVAKDVKPLSPVSVDTTGPADVTSVSVTSGIDTSGYLGFNGYADISWPAVSDSTLRGYRIRFSNNNGTSYSYVNSPGTGTTYRLGGLAIGSTYKIAVATYDEFNNTSSNYVSLSPDLTISGTPSVSSYITAGPFQFGVGVGSVSTNKGLYLNSSNYWYIDSASSAQLKVGGSTSNYLSWNGSSLAIDGDITARSGYFAGNVQIISGGSVYSGTVGGSSGNAGFILNNSGLRFDNGTTQGITEIVASSGQFNTVKANIGGWTINSSSIKRTGGSGQGNIELNSSLGYISVSNDNIATYTAGINSAGTLATDNVFWAGSGGYSSESNAFRVTLSGKLYASGADISGTLSSSIIKGGKSTANDTSAGYYLDSTGNISMTATTPNSGDRAYDSDWGIKIGSHVTGTIITGIPIQGNTVINALGYSQLITQSGYVYDSNGNILDNNNPPGGVDGTPYLGLQPFGQLGRQRMAVENPKTGALNLGLAVYYQDTSGVHTGNPTYSTGVVGDLLVQY